MKEQRYFDQTLTPSLEQELEQIQFTLRYIEDCMKVKAACEQIRIVSAEPELPLFKGWAEVLSVVAVMGIAGLMLTGLIGGAMYFFARFFHVAN